MSDPSSSGATPNGALRQAPAPRKAPGYQLPPQSIEAEQALCGACLMGADKTIAAVWEIVRPSDFYRIAHQAIFSAIIRLWQASQPVDMVTVKDTLAQRNMLDTIGGVAYLMAVYDAAPTDTNAVYYARIVADKALQRGLLGAASEISSAARNVGSGAEGEPDDAEQLVAAAEASLAKAIAGSTGRRGGLANGPGMLRDILPGVMEEIERMEEAPGGGITGLSTGFRALDWILLGLRPGEVTILGGRPGQGKTAMLTSLAANIGVNLRKRAYIASMEMPRRQIVRRVLSAESSVPLRHIMTGRGESLSDGKLSRDQWQRLTDANARMWDANVLIDDARALTVPELRNRLRLASGTLGGMPDAVFVDYLQLMQSANPARHRGNRNSEMDEICQALQAMAGDFGTHLVLLSQLNRNVEHRPDKHPCKADLRDSGSIEAIADVIALLYRPSVYERTEIDAAASAAGAADSPGVGEFPEPPEVNEGLFEEDREDEVESPRALAAPVDMSADDVEIIIDKNRNGEEGWTRMLFRPALTRFEDWSPRAATSSAAGREGGGYTDG